MRATIYPLKTTLQVSCLMCAFGMYLIWYVLVIWCSFDESHQSFPEIVVSHVMAASKCSESLHARHKCKLFILVCVFSLWNNNYPEWKEKSWHFQELIFLYVTKFGKTCNLRKHHFFMVFTMFMYHFSLWLINHSTPNVLYDSIHIVLHTYQVFKTLFSKNSSIQFRHFSKVYLYVRTGNWNMTIVLWSDETNLFFKGLVGLTEFLHQLIKQSGPSNFTLAPDGILLTAQQLKCFCTSFQNLSICVPHYYLMYELQQWFQAL